MKELASSIYVKILIVVLAGLPVAVLTSEIMTPPVVSCGASSLADSIFDDLDEKKLDSNYAQELAHKYGLSWLSVSRTLNKKTQKVSTGISPGPIDDGVKIADRNECRFLDASFKNDTATVQYSLRVPTLWSLLRSGNLWTSRIMLPQAVLIGVELLVALVVLVQITVVGPVNAISSAAERFRTITDGLIGTLRKQWTAGEVLTCAERVGDVLKGAPAPQAAAGDGGNFSRSIDERFFEKMSEKIGKCNSMKKAAQEMLGLLSSESADSGQFAGFVVALEASEIKLLHSTQMPDGFMKEKDGALALALRTVLSAVGSYSRLDAAGILPEPYQAMDMLAAGVSTLSDQKVYLVALSTKGENTATSKIERLLRAVAGESGSLLRLLALKDREFSSARTCSITGLPNLKAADEFCAAFDRDSDGGTPPQMSCVVIEGDHFMFYNTTYGTQVGDQLIAALARIIEEKRQAIAKDSTLYRLPACRFLLLHSGERAFPIAETIRKAVADHNDWPVLPVWSVSTGVGHCPSDGKKLAQVLQVTTSCLDFIKSLCVDNRTMQVATLPKAARAKALGDRNPVFDPFQIVENHVFQQGLITSKDTDGRLFFMTVKDGSLEKAKLGNFTSDLAVLEFLTTFDEGSYEFKEFSSANLDLINRLGAETEIIGSTSDLLLQAADGREKLVRARSVVTRPDSYLFPLPQGGDAWEKLAQSEEAPDEYDSLVMKAILEVTSGNLKFQEVQAKLAEIPIPTYLVWHGTALLLQHKMVKFSNFRVAGDRALQ